MKAWIQFPLLKSRWTRIVLVIALISPSVISFGFPVSQITFHTDQPFTNSSGVHSLTSTDGFLTVAAWADQNASVAANLYQWWWIYGVDSGTGNGALLDGTEAMTLQFTKGVCASHIEFLYTGGSGGTSNLARLSIAGFLSDPGAYATVYNASRIFNLNYSGDTLTFDYLWDNASDYGLLFFSNPAASAGRTLKITGALSPLGDATGWGAALFSVNSGEGAGGPSVVPVNVRHNAINSYTTPDNQLTLRAYSDANATTPANFGTYLDQCFGVYGAANTGAIDTDESITLQFASGTGLARLEAIYSQGNVSISGFASDPGFTDLGAGAMGISYSSGVLNFSPVDGGRHIYFFTNRTASAGRTLRINVDPASGNQLAIAALGYVDSHTLIAPDVPSNVETTHSTRDGLLTLQAYSDTPGTTPAFLYENVDWLGIFGGNNEAIDGTESLQLQFAGGVGLSGFGTRYTSGQVIISGFTSDPGFNDPSGTASDVTYSAGTLSYTFNSPSSPEHVVTFSNVGASAGQTLSMHTDANAGSQIALTRINYSLALVSISIARSGSDVVLTWPNGTLQQSINASTGYSNVLGAASPYTNAITAGQKFYRLKVQ